MLMRRDKVPENYEYQKTCEGYTRTSEGDIPHKSVVLGDYVFLAPVKLHTWRKPNGLRAPVKNAQGVYLYALPGGSESAL